MRVLVSGSSGLVGSALLPALEKGGHEAVRLVRGRARAAAGDISWDPAGGRLDTADLEGVDAVVHLAGESIAAARWTKRQKERIRSSRVDGTRLVAGALARLRPPPRLLVSASAVGYYGDRGDEELGEDSPPGTGFLAEVATGWEAATRPAEEHGIRVVCLRLGMVLSAAGGALRKLLGPFRLGVGGRVGRGQQYMSWVHIDDVVAVVLRALEDTELRGPVNVVSPHPVRNAEFTRALASVLSRPAVLPLPAVAVRLLIGEMADELLLASARVLPRRLLERGHTFRYPLLEAALRHLVEKKHEA